MSNRRRFDDPFLAGMETSPRFGKGLSIPYYLTLMWTGLWKNISFGQRKYGDREQLVNDLMLSIHVTWGHKRLKMPLREKKYWLLPNTCRSKRTCGESNSKNADNDDVLLFQYSFLNTPWYSNFVFWARDNTQDKIIMTSPATRGGQQKSTGEQDDRGTYNPVRRGGHPCEYFAYLVLYYSWSRTPKLKATRKSFQSCSFPFFLKIIMTTNLTPEVICRFAINEILIVSCANTHFYARFCERIWGNVFLPTVMPNVFWSEIAGLSTHDQQNWYCGRRCMTRLLYRRFNLRICGFIFVWVRLTYLSDITFQFLLFLFLSSCEKKILLNSLMQVTGLLDLASSFSYH